MSKTPEDKASSEVFEKQTKKRQRHGRMTEVCKQLNLQSHSEGGNCNCKRKCFEVVPQTSRNKILQEFNLMKSHTDQNTYLSGLISIVPVQRRRPRKPEEVARLRDVTFKFRVRVHLAGSNIQDVEVCRQAFISIHGISNNKVYFLTNSLKTDGTVAKDRRGTHTTRPRKLSLEILNCIRDHINSFPSRNSHYGLNESKKIYLCETLNIRKMYTMFLEIYQNISVSYESYRSIFNNEFNIAFGYPRVDTCSTCDADNVELKALQLKKNKETDDQKISEIEKQIKIITTRNTLHNQKAKAFYTIKKNSKLAAKKTLEKEAICMDFLKNLPVPNITTNDVYYKRQLSVFAFNIHILSSSESIFYMYPETVAKKGSDDVCSMLHHFVYNFLDMRVRHLEIFCDSCSGQNKNYCVFRFLHNLVHVEKRFESIKVTFPIRGHSYLECDKNMGLVNQKSRAETPNEWIDVFRQSRVKPSPFTVVNANSTIFRKWTAFLSPKYKKIAPFKCQPIRQYKIMIEHPRLAYHRGTYNGPWYSAILCGSRKSNQREQLGEREFFLPDYSYNGPIPIKKLKFDNLQDLKRFCGEEAQAYFSQLLHE